MSKFNKDKGVPESYTSSWQMIKEAMDKLKGTTEKVSQSLNDMNEVTKATTDKVEEAIQAGVINIAPVGTQSPLVAIDPGDKEGVEVINSDKPVYKNWSVDKTTAKVQQKFGPPTYIGSTNPWTTVGHVTSFEWSYETGANPYGYQDYFEYEEDSYAEEKQLIETVEQVIVSYGPPKGKIGVAYMSNPNGKTYVWKEDYGWKQVSSELFQKYWKNKMQSQQDEQWINNTDFDVVTTPKYKKPILWDPKPVAPKMDWVNETFVKNKPIEPTIFKDAKLTSEKLDISKSLFFRTNCSNWHEIIKPEDHKHSLFESINGEIQWYHSSASPEKTWGCGHDAKRIVPTFNAEQHAAKIEEISNNQSGNTSGSLYIQTKEGWDTVPKKMTLTIGKNNRSFHHHSNVKVWYICLTSEELKKVKSGKIPESVLEDCKYIFKDAVPYSGAFSWYHESTVIHKVQKETDNLVENLMHKVNLAQHHVEMSKSTNKKQNYEPMNPTSSSNDYYNGTQCDYSGYFSYFACLEDYDNNYLRTKAIQAHKYIMFDLKLSLLKKDKKAYTKSLKNLEELQIHWAKAEDYFLEKYKPTGYKKPYVKAQSIYRYLHNNNYGIPE